MINIVKPLVWVSTYSKINEFKEYSVILQHTGTYTARLDVRDETGNNFDENLCLCVWHQNYIPTMEEARKICEAHYEKSILERISAEAKAIFEQFNSTDNE